MGARASFTLESSRPPPPKRRGFSLGPRHMGKGAPSLWRPPMPMLRGPRWKEAPTPMGTTVAPAVLAWEAPAKVLCYGTSMIPKRRPSPCGGLGETKAKRPMIPRRRGPMGVNPKRRRPAASMIPLWEEAPTDARGPRDKRGGPHAHAGPRAHERGQSEGGPHAHRGPG